ncbi:MAG: CheR family methyltransferase, partial [Promethearchaeota archaeon]
QIFVVETKNQLVEIRKKFEKFIEIENISLLSYGQFKKTNEKFDLIVCSNILHIIPLKEKRMEILNTICKKLKNGGFLYIKTAGESISHISSSKRVIKYGDGYAFIFKKKNNKNFATFRTGFSKKQLISIIPKELKIQKEFKINSKEISMIFKKNSFDNKN